MLLVDRKKNVYNEIKICCCFLADERILETSRLAGPNTVIQFCIEIIRCNFISVSI